MTSSGDFIPSTLQVEFPFDDWSFKLKMSRRPKTQWHHSTLHWSCDATTVKSSAHGSRPLLQQKTHNNLGLNVCCIITNIFLIKLSSQTFFFIILWKLLGFFPCDTELRKKRVLKMDGWIIIIKKLINLPDIFKNSQSTNQELGI